MQEQKRANPPRLPKDVIFLSLGKNIFMSKHYDNVLVFYYISIIYVTTVIFHLLIYLNTQFSDDIK